MFGTRAAILASLGIHAILLGSLALVRTGGEPDLSPPSPTPPLRIGWVPALPPPPAPSVERVPTRERTFHVPGGSSAAERAEFHPSVPSRRGEPAPPRPWSFETPPATPEPDVVLTREEASPRTPLPPATPRVAVESSGPRLETRLRPRYPDRCRQLDHEGVALLRLEVDERGRVTAVAILESAGCPRLDEAAREAALDLRYRPARVGESAVSGETTLRIRFDLR